MKDDKRSSNDKPSCDDRDSVFNFHKGCLNECKWKCLTFFLDLLYYGILNLAQKAVSEYADGEASLAMWKNSLADYHDTKKVHSEK